MSENDKNKSASKLSVLEQWKQRKLADKSVNKLEKKPEGVVDLATKGQQRIWLLQQLNPENIFYQYAHAYHISGPLKEAALLESFRSLKERHKILRSNFVEKETKLELLIKDKKKLDYTFYDISEKLAQDKKLDEEILTKEFTQLTFDLENDHLFRICLIKKSETEHVLLFSIHHIIGDRDSLLIINREVWEKYHALAKSENFQKEDLAIQYEDYAHWQNNLKTTEKVKTYWTDKLAGDLAILDLPKTYERPKIPNYKGAVLKQFLTKQLSSEIIALSKASDTTPYAFLLTAFKILMHKYSRQKDIIIGTPISTKDNTQLENLIGFFNETIAIRSEIDTSEPFQDYLAKIKNTTLEGLEHRKMPFDELVQLLQPQRIQNIQAIFQVMFLYNKASSENYNSDLLTIQDESIDLGVSKFDLTLFVNETKEGLELALEYATELFDSAIASQMLNHLNNLLAEVIKNPQQKIRDIALLSQEEKELILHKWNDNPYTTPPYDSVTDIILSNLPKDEKKVAVSFLGEDLTYKDLDRTSTYVAQAILASKIEHNIVGLYTDRSLEMVIGILGIMKAGKAYLPLDPAYPEERISYMISDAKVELVLTKDNENNLTFNSSTIIAIKDTYAQSTNRDIPLPKIDKEHLAYVIYTSGSTGKPKGVPISHANLMHSTWSRTAFYPENPGAFLLLSSFSFDSSIVGIFWTLCTGGRLVLPIQRIEQDIGRLGNLIQDYSITHMLLLPSLYGTIINLSKKEKISSLQNVMVAGEACPLGLVQQHYSKLDQTILYNEYGPTEASVWCIAHTISPEEKQYVPIGKAIPGTAIYILDEALKVCPKHVAGEIHVGGPGLSSGYLNRPALTEEKFIPNPYVAKTKLYKTGDLGRYNDKGIIEFLGRVDNQVKIRGYRIELSEIENIMTSYLEKEAIVNVYHTENKDHKKLVAYYVKDISKQESALITQLKEQLPHYMVPSTFIALDDFPRLPNGKINRKKLPLPNSGNQVKKLEYEAPRGELEILLSEIWEEVLQQSDIGRQDNFFEIGGDSILSIQIISKARDQGITLKPNAIFEFQTIATLANNIEINTKSESLSIDDVEIHYGHPLSSVQQAFLFNYNAKGKDEGELLLNFEIIGDIDVNLINEAWRNCAILHPVLRTYIVASQGRLTEQQIAENKVVNIEWLDYSHHPSSEKVKLIDKLKSSLARRKTNLYQIPCYELFLVKTDKQKSVLLWKCHHLFLDGWSCGIIIKDLLRIYDHLKNGIEPETKSKINFPSYLAWKQLQETEIINTHWNKRLIDFKSPLLFEKTSPGTSFKNINTTFSKAASEKIYASCSKLRITQSTFFQAIFSMLLGHLFNTDDVVYGLTVTGRNQSFPEIESICGLFMNTIPARIKINKKESFANWLRTIQQDLGKQNIYESHALENIKNSISWPLQLPLFDSLFVFGNFLEEDYTIGSLTIRSFEGGFSSNFPLTVRVNPTSEIGIDVRYNTDVVSDEIGKYFVDSFHKLSGVITENNTVKPVHNFLTKINDHDILPLLETTAIRAATTRPVLRKSIIKAGRNLVEKQLIDIWEDLFQIKPISVDDNFFDLGGNSMMALQLFSRIEKKLDIVIAPASLYKNPTIEKLALLVQGESLATEELIIPLRQEGTQSPLFCIHGGGAHVFFYQDLSNHIDEDIPVYSIQPKGLDGKSSKHLSISEMATDYITEIKQIQPEGPYNMLGTCFSNAVALEMGKQFIEAGDAIGNIFIIDSAPVHLFGDDEAGKTKTLKRFIDMLKRGDFQRIKSKLSRRLSSNNKDEKTPKIKDDNTAALNLQSSIDMLNKLYADYNWEPIDASINFIRSSEFNQRADKKYHLGQWRKLAKKGVTTYVVDGHHASLFIEPEVMGLSRKISECILDTK